MNPLRDLDEAGLDLKSPATYMIALDRYNNVDGAVESSIMTGIAEHVHFTFVVTTSLLVILPLYCDVKILRVSTTDEDVQLYIMTASVADWKSVTLKHCHIDSPSKLRWIMNRIMNHLETAGFRALWYSHEKHQLPDQTFVLR